jgi:hypothetical protein
MSLPTPPETPPRTPPRRSQQRDPSFLLKDGQYAFKVGKGKIDPVHVSLDAEKLSAQLGRLDPDALRRDICSPLRTSQPASQECKYTPPPTPPGSPPPTPPHTPPPASQEGNYLSPLKYCQYAFKFENGKLDATPVFSKAGLLSTSLLRKPFPFGSSSTDSFAPPFRPKEKNDAGPLSPSDDNTAQEKRTHCQMSVVSLLCFLITTLILKNVPTIKRYHRSFIKMLKLTFTHTAGQAQ